MKKYFTLLLIFCSGSIALAQNQTPYQTKLLSNEGIKGVKVETSGGSISVSGASGESPRIEIYVKGNNGRELSKEEIEKRLTNDYILEVSVTNHELYALAKRRREGGMFDWNRSLSISFKIYTPNQVSTKLSTSGGSIHLDNLTGDEYFSTSGGSLHIANVTGNIKGETSGGSIEVSNSKNLINLETSGGSVRASNCSGKIRLETSGGSLSLDNLDGTIQAETSGGSIRAQNIKGELNTATSGGSVSLMHMACSLNASTSGGSMRVDIDHLGKYVKLDVSGGRVDLKLPGGAGMDLDLSASKINAASLNRFSGSWEKDHVKGSLNGGGVPVKVDASDNINLSFE